MDSIIIDKEEYSIACKEVLEIFKNIKEEDLEKIPSREIEKLRQNANNKYEFTYNAQKNIKEQNVSKLAKAIIANFFIKYIANKEQKEKIFEKQKYDLNLLEQEKIRKYGENDIFASKKQKINPQKVYNILPIVTKKETFWSKVLKHLRKVFKI